MTDFRPAFRSRDQKLFSMRLKKELTVIERSFKILCAISFVDESMRKMAKRRRECLEYI